MIKLECKDMEKLECEDPTLWKEDKDSTHIPDINADYIIYNIRLLICKTHSPLENLPDSEKTCNPKIHSWFSKCSHETPCSH